LFIDVSGKASEAANRASSLLVYGSYQSYFIYRYFAFIGIDDLSWEAVA